MTDIILCIGIILLAIICGTAMIVKEVKQSTRQVPYGKVFIKEFVAMVDDIRHALIYCRLSCIDVTVNKYKFRVSVKDEVPYDGLEYEITPVYKSFAVYIDDEIVCRVHRICHCYKDHYFIEFSSKRERDEVIEIIKKAHIEAKEHNYGYVKKLFSKYNSKSFYQDYSSSEE